MRQKCPLGGDREFTGASQSLHLDPPVTAVVVRPCDEPAIEAEKIQVDARNRGGRLVQIVQEVFSLELVAELSLRLLDFAEEIPARIVVVQDAPFRPIAEAFEPSLRLEESFGVLISLADMGRQGPQVTNPIAAAFDQDSRIFERALRLSRIEAAIVLPAFAVGHLDVSQLDPIPPAVAFDVLGHRLER